MAEGAMGSVAGACRFLFFFVRIPGALEAFIRLWATKFYYMLEVI